MNVLVLTSDHPRHLYLVYRLLQAGHTVKAWGESKGGALNEKQFVGEHAALLNLHRDALNAALDQVIPPVEVQQLPLEMFERGVFRDERMVAAAQAFAPDAVLTYGCGIVGTALIEAFRDRIIGSHQGLPQYYRGTGSNFFAFLDQKASWMGVSVHLLDQGIDSGAVLYQYAPLPELSDSYYSYSARLVHATVDLYLKLLETLPLALTTRAMPLSQPGQLYQRKDFTVAALQTGLLMQLERSFHAWYQQSLAQVGAPALLGEQ